MKSMNRIKFWLSLVLTVAAVLRLPAQGANKLERVGFGFGNLPTAPHLIEGTNAWAYRIVEGRVNDIHRATNWFRVSGRVTARLGSDLVVEGAWGDGVEFQDATYVLRNFSNEVSKAVMVGNGLPGSFCAKFVGETNVTSRVLGTRDYKVFDYGRPVAKPTISSRDGG